MYLTNCCAVVMEVTCIYKQCALFVCLDTGEVALLLLSTWSVGTEALLLIHLLIVCGLCRRSGSCFKLCCIMVISQDIGFLFLSAEEDIDKVYRSCI